ncbi:PRC-barrel domain-containing protein [uncultured Imperialibacter sp.]|uniref:PRC-barrel domain-containing protein n=1 Tax=uncultured Imperialibacter sp. TaxID=1672639 RepID=UPI0030DA5335|tara:strand:- start:24136 stop:24558 length:423 start_codon:yes stop_codon:yes gene_type:complete
MKSFKEDNTTNKNHSGAHANLPLKFLTATSIIGDRVFNKGNEDMGEIKDVMIDLTTGQIEYFVIELGGFLGIGEKYFAIPFAFLAVDPKKQAFVINQEADTLKNAPGFDKEHWPETNSHDFDGYQSYWGSFMGVNVGYTP